MAISTLEMLKSSILFKIRRDSRWFSLDLLGFSQILSNMRKNATISRKFSISISFSSWLYRRLYKFSIEFRLNFWGEGRMKNPSKKEGLNGLLSSKEAVYHKIITNYHKISQNFKFRKISQTSAKLKTSATLQRKLGKFRKFLKSRKFLKFLKSFKFRKNRKFSEILRNVQIKFNSKAINQIARNSKWKSNFRTEIKVNSRSKSRSTRGRTQGQLGVEIKVNLGSKSRSIRGRNLDQLEVESRWNWILT